MIFDSDEDFDSRRRRVVERLSREGSIKSESVEEAMLSVKRENFMPSSYEDKSYDPHNPYPIPGKNASISALDTYALFYEELDLGLGENFLEVGSGSGYGSALAKEIVGDEGDVITLEIDKNTYKFAKNNLRNYEIEIIRKDGRRGYEENSPYDKIAITAATSEIPDPLREQLKEGGKIIAPVNRRTIGQKLTLFEKTNSELKSKPITGVRYVKLQKKNIKK